ncbi:ABC transporter ATP-binding protein [Peribacillus sp. SCS-37]|uniref:ABC transporter ATP-binding protein n=1 Tax=Paraperibacillus esterisolvens TaxID=3115296 RepID=UPI003905F59C
MELRLRNLRSYFKMKDFRRVYDLLAPLILKNKKYYAGLSLLLFTDIFFTIAFASFYGHVTDAAVRGDLAELRGMLWRGAALILLGAASGYLNICLETAAANGVKRDLKNLLFSRILRLPAGKSAAFVSGDLMSHFTNDIHHVDGVIGSNLIELVRLPLIYIAVFVYLYQINSVLVLWSLAASPAAMIAGVVFGLLLRRTSRRMNDLLGRINILLSETFQGFQVIRSFTLEKSTYQDFASKSEDLYKLEMGFAKVQGWFYSGGQLVNSFVFILCLCLGAFYVSKGEMSVGSLLAFTNLVGHLVYPLTGIAGQWAALQRSITALERIGRVLDTDGAVKELPSYEKPDSHTADIEFQDVTFSHEEGQVLFQNLNFVIPGGMTAAIVGPSGAGKTSILNLLQGFYEPQNGRVLLNGSSIEDMTVSSLRSMFSLVSQETFLFAGTIRENLVLARPGVTEEEMINAARQADIHDFITSLPDGYDTEVGERGARLSGGQKQRIAIARALLKDAPILLLDEATSALDAETENQVQHGLAELTAGKTSVIIAHRLSTIKYADWIFVLDGGKIIQQGRHEQLINQEGIYQKLYQSNFKSYGETRELASI